MTPAAHRFTGASTRRGCDARLRRSLGGRIRATTTTSKPALRAFPESFNQRPLDAAASSS